MTGVPEGPIWFVGCGNMGCAILGRWLADGLDPARVTVIRRSDRPLAVDAGTAPAALTILQAPPPDGTVPAIVVLAVKPQMLDAVAPALAPLMGAGTLLVSILAGVEVAALRRRFPVPRAILRAMPNTPVAIGQGVVALHGDGLDAAGCEAAVALMAPLGLVEWVDEALFDIATAVAGSGPAFLFRFVDALAAAGREAGLRADQAARLALATVSGAGLLAAGSDESPAALADRVASPGGSTRAGLDMLDRPEALGHLLAETIAASVRRNRELAAAAR